MSTIEADAATVAIAMSRTLAQAVANEPTRATPVTAVRLRSGASVDLTPVHDGVIGWPHGPRPPRYEAVVAHNLDEIAHAARLLAWTAAGYHALALADARQGTSSHPRVPLDPQGAEVRDADVLALFSALADRMASRCPHPVTVPLSRGAVDMATLPNKGRTIGTLTPGAVFAQAHGAERGHVITWALSDDPVDLVRTVQALTDQAHAAA